MAITPDKIEQFTNCFAKFQDANKQKYTVSWLVQYDTGETAVTFRTGFIAFLGHLEALSNCKVIESYVEDANRTTFVSDKTPGTANFATIDQVLLLDMQRANPLRPELVINKPFPIPAYISGKASKNAPNLGQVNETDGDITAVINWLTAHLGFRYQGDGNLYYGFAYQGAESGGISAPDVVDNE